MINNLINFIENLKIEQMLLVFGIYLFFLWLLVPIWVYLDSRKKFENEWLPPLLFVLVLPLNIPGLLFYIIIRPEDDLFEDIADDHVVNIPIVNFVSDKNDLVFGFEIKLNGDIIKESAARDINLKVDLDHADTITFKNDKKVTTITNVETKDSLISKVKSKVSGIIANFKKDTSETKKEDEAKKVEVTIGANTNNSAKPVVNENKPSTINNNQHHNHQNNNQHNHQHNQNNKPNTDKKDNNTQENKTETVKVTVEGEGNKNVEEKKA